MENHELNQGSCLCGQVKFEINGGFESFYLCHCSFCQKDTGSAHAANLFSAKARLTWLQGQELVNSYNLPGTLHTKAFCKICGSAMPKWQMGGGLLVVPAGSLDSKIAIRPLAHIFCSSRAIWDHDLESLEKLDAAPK